MSKSLVFYTNPQSRGRIVRWMLEECGADYDTEVIAYGEAMKGDAYRAINPMGKVPALKVGDAIVTECAAICACLADLHPDANLAPPTTERAAYYRWLFFAAGPLEQAVTNHALGFDPSPDQERMAGYGNYGAVMDVLEGQIARDEYATGPDFTAVDVYLGAQVIWGLQFGTMDKRPAFETYVSRLTSREAYRRATELDDALAA